MTTDPTPTLPAHRFYIVNDYDCPSARLIAEKRANSKFYYVHPTLCNDKSYHGMTPTKPTPLDDFGIDWKVEDGRLFGTRLRETTATYNDGRIRQWQDDPTFNFKLP